MSYMFLSPTLRYGTIIENFNLLYNALSVVHNTVKQVWFFIE